MRVRALPWLAFTASSLAPSIARAHAADLGRPRAELERTFTLDAAVVVPALVLSALFALGASRMRSRHPVRDLRVRAACFLGALALVVAAVCTPLDALSSALFSAHMVQHLVLVIIAGPLLARSAPGPVLLWSLPSPVRRALPRFRVLERLARVVFAPASALALHAVALLAWHLPVLYEAALRDDTAHAMEHATLLGTAWLYWRAILRADAMGHGAAVLYAFAGGLLGTVLGALLTVAETPIYSVHAGGPEQFGLTRLEDQQLAGLSMWVPGGAVYLAASLRCFAGWLRASELRAARAER